MYKLIVAILLAAVFCVDAFGIIMNLYPLRLVLPIAFMYALVAFVQRFLVEKHELNFPVALFFSFLFFAYSFIHTSVVSGLHYYLEGREYPLTDVANYIVYFLLVSTLFLLSLLDLKRFFQLAIKVSAVFYVLYFLFAIFEMKTGYHLPVSNMVDAAAWKGNVPTVVFHNSNDFASIFTVLFVFLFCQMKTPENLINQALFVFLIIAQLYILYITQSRLSLLVFVLFVLYKYPKKLLIVGGLSGVFLLGSGYLADSSYYLQLISSVDKLLADLSFGERGSSMVRVALYKHALHSVQDYWGMGHGINASLEYYRSVTDPNLHYITNPHSFIFEILINSGVIVTLLYIILNVYLIFQNWLKKNYDLIAQLIIYNLLLFSSSSSLFLWPIYLFFFLYVIQLSLSQLKSKQNKELCSC